MMKAFKCRLYPTRQQAGTLQFIFDCCRELYNARREAYRMASKSISGYYDQQNDLPEIKEKCAYQFLYL